MTFPDSVIEDAWERAGDRCECRRRTHGHRYVRCPKKLVFANRGRDGRGAWEAHHLNSNGPDTLSNCQILCWPCHSMTFRGPG